MRHRIEGVADHAAERGRLASRCCRGLDGAAYLARRAGYDAVAAAWNGDELRAFSLYRELWRAGERHIYIGPTFSQDAACVALFAWQMDAWLAEGAFHVLIEAQSPRVIALFHSLFPVSAWPRPAGPVPEPILSIARRFEQLPQVGAISDVLSTKNAETLYGGPGRHRAIVDWLAARDVRLDRGDAQVLLVSGHPALRAELDRGLQATLAAA